MITAYVKPTNFCPVGCTHCYLPEDVRADKDLMSFPTLISTARMLADLAESKGLPTGDVNILWHGGEVLTVPVDWYWAAGEILDDLLPGHVEMMQTSLIPYRSKYAELINTRLGSSLGSSIDFSSRTIKGSNERYADKWLKKVDEARSDGISVFPITVPTKNELGRAKEMIAWFLDHGFKAFSLERYNTFGTTYDDWITNAEHSSFLIDLFDEAMSLFVKGVRVNISTVVSGIGGVLYGRPGDRWGGKCQSDFVVVEPDGALNACPDKANSEDPYSFAKEGARAFLGSPLRRKWIRLQTVGHRNPYCGDCENINWCGSGCPITPNQGEMEQTECSGFKSFIDHVRAFTCDEDRRALVTKYHSECTT